MMDEEIPTVKSMEAVDIHLRMIVRELREIKGTQDAMLDKLATKVEVTEKIAFLQKQIDAITPRSIWKRMTEIAVGVTALSACAGVIVAIVKWAKL